MDPLRRTWESRDVMEGTTGVQPKALGPEVHIGKACRHVNRTSKRESRKARLANASAENNAQEVMAMSYS